MNFKESFLYFRHFGLLFIGLGMTEKEYILKPIKVFQNPFAWKFKYFLFLSLKLTGRGGGKHD